MGVPDSADSADSGCPGFSADSAWSTSGQLVGVPDSRVGVPDSRIPSGCPGFSDSGRRILVVERAVN